MLLNLLLVATVRLTKPSVKTVNVVFVLFGLHNNLKVVLMLQFFMLFVTNTRK